MPSLFSELEGPALAGIIDELCGADFIDHVIIGLDQADAEQFAYAREYFSRLPQLHEILWNDGPRLPAIDDVLAQANLLFAGNIVAAGNVFLENPMDAPFIASWNRVVSAVPNILDDLRQAVEEDAAEFGG